MASTLLPERFADLQAFAGWSIDTEAARSQRRRDSTFDEIRLFYDAMLPRLSDALDYLNGFSLDKMPEPEQRLLNVCLAFAEIAPFVEQYKRVIHTEMFDERRFVPVHDQTDKPA